MKIRKLEEQDLATRVEWINDVRINATLNIATPISLESTKRWFESIQINEQRIDFAFTILDEVVAMGGFTNIDKECNKAELYIFVNPNIKGKGYGTQAVKLMCNYGFKELEFKKIYLHTNSDNFIARRLYEKVGFLIEGLMTKEFVNNGILKERIYYAIYNKLP